MNQPLQHIVAHKFQLQFSLFGQSSSAQIRIVPVDSNGKMYKASIDNKTLQQCSVSNFDQLRFYLLQSPDHWQLSQQQKKLIILAVTNIRGKKNKFELTRISVEQVQLLHSTDGNNDRKSSKHLLMDIISKCNTVQQLSNEKIKKIFIQLAKFVSDLEKQQKEAPADMIDSIISKIMVVGSQNQNLKARLIQIQSKNNQKYSQITTKIAQTKKQLMAVIDAQRTQLTLNGKLIQDKLCTQLKRIFEEMQVNIHNRDDINIGKEDKSGKKMSQRYTIQEYFDIARQQRPNYQLNKYKITKIASNNGNSGLIGKIKIVNRSSFVVKVDKTKSWGISLGIKDLNSGQIIKYGGNGWISNCSNTIYSQGKGIGTNDIVTTSVDLQKGLIKWRIQNKGCKYEYQTRCENTKISNKDRNWVPFIAMSSDQDNIELL